MAVVAVPFILYLVRFCSPKPCKKEPYSTGTERNENRPASALVSIRFSSLASYCTSMSLVPYRTILESPRFSLASYEYEFSTVPYDLRIAQILTRIVLVGTVQVHHGTVRIENRPYSPSLRTV